MLYNASSSLGATSSSRFSGVNVSSHTAAPPPIASNGAPASISSVAASEYSHHHPSASAVGGGMLSHHGHHGGANNHNQFDLSSLGGANGAASSSNGVAATLFDAEVPVHVKQQDREEVYQPLGVCVSVGKGGPTGVSKCVTVRLTDPKDPFFLFSMTLLEDDYGRFKERHELMVDFNGFPRDLVGMLSSIGTGGGGAGSNIVTFVADGKDSCVLRILERTEFRALEHIALNMSRQGDVGQKRYLAEKFQHFLHAFTRSEHERKEEVLQYERLVSECREELRNLTAERDQLLERTRSDASTAASNQLTAIGLLKDQHAAEVRQLQATAEEARAELSRKMDALMTQHNTEMRAKDVELATLRTTAGNAESMVTMLSSQLRTANDSVAALTTEAEHLRKDNEGLVAFRQTATQQLNEKELAHVAGSERIRHLSETLKSREEDLKSLREAQGSQDGYAKMLAGQLSALQEKVRTTEASLSKAHHILGTQVQALRSAKDKHAALKGQIDANETLLGEKNNLIERLRGDLMSSGDKVESLQGKVTELKDQLMKSEEQHGKAIVQLKQNEDALIHMQRMSSGFGARTFGASGASGIPTPSHGSSLKLNVGGLGGSIGGTSTFSTANLYRQFAAGAQMGSAASITGAGAEAASSPLGDASPPMAQSEGASTTGNSPTATTIPPVPTATPATAASLAVNNQLLTGYNSLSSGAAVLSNRTGYTAGAMGAGLGIGGSTYPYTSSSPVQRTPLGVGTSNPMATSSVAYLPPKATLSGGSYASEKPSAYFGAN